MFCSLGYLCINRYDFLGAMVPHVMPAGVCSFLVGFLFSNDIEFAGITISRAAEFGGGDGI